MNEEPCATCAFRPGTRANQDGITLLKARLCALAGDEFNCHENAVFVTDSGKMIDPAERNRFDVLTPNHLLGHYEPKPGEQWKPCVGYQRMLSGMQSELRGQPEWKLVLSVKLLDIIERAEAAGQTWTAEQSEQAIRQAIEEVSAETL